MAVHAARRSRLYGADRKLAADKNTRTLTESHVLQHGEYNFTDEKLKDDVWQTNSMLDFPGAEIANDYTVVGVGQLKHHFDLGNDSGNQLPVQTYQGSITKDDFKKSNSTKTKILAADRTINWPDMAARYAPDRDTGQSEYKNTFTMAELATVPPDFPKVNTSKLALPLDPSKYYLHGGTNVKFGDDKPSIISEHQLMYGPATQADLASKMAKAMEALKIRKKMKDADMTSNVFRDGDYNGIAHNYQTSNVEDYGPRTKPPAEILASELYQEHLRTGLGPEKKEGPLLKNVPNELTSYARAHTVPMVFKDALAERNYQTSAHFKLGSEEGQVASIYAKDFSLGTMAPLPKPAFYVPPSAGNLLQNDPQFSKFGSTSSQADYTFTTKPLTRDADGKTAVQRNMQRQGVNVCFTYDVKRHVGDRQHSLAHGDYKNPPSSFKALKAVGAPKVEFDYLQTNDALPYRTLPRLSEAKNTFSGALHSSQLRDKHRQQVERWKEGDEMCRRTHFTLGYAGPDFVSETNNQFHGRPSTDNAPAAGMSESIHPTKFEHLNVSENTMDMRAADPYVTSSKEALTIRRQFEPALLEHPHNTSVMHSDFKPMNRRSMNAHQLRMLEKYESLTRKSIERSHFFHFDTSGRNNYLSTTMDDFIQPEVMTGQKILAAR